MTLGGGEDVGVGRCLARLETASNGGHHGGIN